MDAANGDIGLAACISAASTALSSYRLMTVLGSVKRRFDLYWLLSLAPASWDGRA
jgi:hypothetical protein